MIQRNIVYPKILFYNSQNKEIHLPIKGLIKDIFWFVRSSTTGKPYIVENEIEVDEFYQEYLDTNERNQCHENG